MLTQIELLAPARDLEAGMAAIDCGADAVYMGGPGFGARRAAGNSVADVAALVRYARPFGVRVYAALNTLLFDSELDEAGRVARELLDAGVDALIVQDMAWLRMGLTGKDGSAVEFHASTQASNIAPDDVAFLGRAGFRRVILERALSLEDIRAIRAATSVPDASCAPGGSTAPPVELEVFVHGAICVGYSGRCYMSRSMGSAGGGGARSGNRGDCSQPCRLAYDLVGEGAGGERKVIIKGKHLLSVRDLDLSAHIGELLDAGVTSFKIEGRLKDVPYVRNVVSYYRRLLDRALATRPSLRRASAGFSEPDFVPDPSKSFTRGSTEWFFGGAVRGVASFDTPKSVGEAIGVVDRTGCDRTGGHWFIIRGADGVAAGLAAGDGVCFFAGGSGGEELQGTNINRVEGGRIYPNRMEGIAAGTEVYRNHDRAFTRALERSRTRRRIRVSARIVMSASEVAVAFTDETGLSAGVSREGGFDFARDPLKMAAVAREQLSKSGDTIFEVADVEVVGGGGVRFVPVSVLAELRREGFARLSALRRGLAPRRDPAVEDMSARLPRGYLTAAENVTNRLAERFYRDHGVLAIEPGLDLRPSMDGEVVMRTRYCIRRETGECLREQGALKGGLFLERGNARWRLGFDCEKCEMTVVKI